jgi:hypothetical protein
MSTLNGAEDGDGVDSKHWPADHCPAAFVPTRPSGPWGPQHAPSSFRTRVIERLKHARAQTARSSTLQRRRYAPGLRSRLLHFPVPVRRVVGLRAADLELQQLGTQPSYVSIPASLAMRSKSGRIESAPCAAASRATSSNASSSVSPRLMRLSRSFSSTSIATPTSTE